MRPNLEQQRVAEFVANLEQPCGVFGKSGGGYRVLHVADHSIPVLDGYAVRTNGIAQAQRILGNKPTVVTSPLHQIHEAGASDTDIDGVRYMRTPLTGGVSEKALRARWPIARELALIGLLRRRILDVLDAGEFDIIHAHSPVLCGLAALQAARARKLPVIYEIRAFWEDAAVDQGRTTTRSPRYIVSRQLEQYVCTRADAVVGIASSILQELHQRKISPEKLFHIANGVDTGRFEPLAKDDAIATQLGIGDIPVLGYIGSLFYFEGVSWLVKAATELRRRGARFKLIIIGHGEDSDAIRREIAEAQAEEFVIFVGKIPHDQVRKYYSVIDVMVYPRRSIRLTELVTPLKPLEAMALGRAVLGSSVGGIRELVKHEETGLLFASENVDDFCKQALRLVDDPYLRQTLAQQGRDMVIREKDWKNIASGYDEIYQFARTNHNRRA